MAGVLFVCAANAACSPIAEAIARHLAPDLDVFSAGIRPSHLRPQVYTILDENGVDPRGLRSKGLLEVPLGEISLVINLEGVPLPPLPGHLKLRDWPLPDPSCAPDDDLEDAFQACFEELSRRIPPMLEELRTMPDRW